MAVSTGTIVGVSLLGGAAYFWFNPRAFTSLLEAFGMDQGQADAITAQAGLAVQPRQPQPNIGTALTMGAAAGANVNGGGIATVGIGAGIGALVYGIAELGWFRGGWEGVKGNTIRDKFLDQFVQTFYPGAGVEMQYEAMVKGLASIGIVGSGEPGSSTPNAGDVIRNMYAANEEAEMRQAIDSWVGLFASRGVQLARPPADMW